MRLKLTKALNAVNTASSVISVGQFTWQLVGAVLHWHHKGAPHHTIELTEEQRRHLAAGGRLECEYDCGNVLVAGR